MSLLPQAFLCLGIICVTWWWWWRKTTKTSDLVINWPVIGMMPGLLCNITRIHDYITDLLRQYGGTFVFKGPWFTGPDFVFTSDPDNVHHVLSKNFSGYHKGPGHKEVFEPLGDGILTSSGHSWKVQRRIIHAVFKDKRFELVREEYTKQKIIDGLFPVLDEALESGCQLDIQDVTQRFMFDTICQIILDHDPRSLLQGLPDLDCAKAFKVIQEVTFYRNITPASIWKLQRWLQVGQEKKLRKACTVLDRFIYGCINSKREQLARDGNRAANLEDQFNLLSYFMADYDADDANDDEEIMHEFKNSDKFLRDTAVNLVAAGRDSVAAGFAWFLWLVATHPRVEEKILEEMRETLHEQLPSDGEKKIFDKEELNKLIYLQACLLETLRLYPTIPVDQTISMGADVLPSGHQLGENTKVVYMPYSMGRMEAIWGEDCLEFKPERWISEDGSIRHVPSYKFTAFNAGPRTCLGKDLAMGQMKMVASAMVWNYQFEMGKSHPVYPTNSVILQMKHGLMIKVLERNGC